MSILPMPRLDKDNPVFNSADQVTIDQALADAGEVVDARGFTIITPAILKKQLHKQHLSKILMRAE